MNFQHFIWLYLWAAPHVLLVAVAVLMVRKQLHRDFPVFFSYLLFEFLQFCVLFTMYLLNAPASAYVKTDIFGRAGSIAFHFGILQELFEAPVAHSFPLRRGTARVLKWVTVFLVALATVFIGSLYNSILGNRVFHPYVIIEALSTAQCGLLALVFLWHRYLGLRMSRFVFGVALGMGLVCGLGPLIQAWNDSLGARNPEIAGMVEMATYHGVVLIWLYCAQAREKVTSDSKAAPLELRERAAELGRIVDL